MSRFNLTAQIQLQAPRNANQVVQQIQRQLQNVNVSVNLQNGNQAQRQIQNLARSTNQAADAGDRLGRALTASVKKYAGLAIATRAVSLFTNTLSNAIDESLKFQRELVKVSQVTGETLRDLKGLTTEITRLSTAFGASSSSLVNVSRILSQAGLSANETRIALDALARSTLAPTFDDITQTAEGAVAIFNQFRQGAEALEQQLGAINAVAGQFAVEAGDLISVIRRTGGVFKAAGGDLNELIALFTSVRSTTRESAESIATGLRTIFTRIQRPKTIEFLREFGVELTDLNGRFVGPFEAVKRLSAALAGLEQGDISFIRIAEELGGFRQIGKVIPLIQQFAVAQEALNVAVNGGNSLSKDAATAQQALSVQISKVKEEFLALIRNVFESTSFQIFAKVTLNIASAIIKVGEALKPVLPLLMAFAGVNIARAGAGIVGGLAGRRRGFASGGLVPGSGSGDTVPAMLTPGEFVIRKSSVAKLGVQNLHSMNKYALGGRVELSGGQIAKSYRSLSSKVNPEQEYSANVNAIAVPTSRVIASMKSRKRNQPSKRNWQLFEEAVASAYGLKRAGGNSYLDYPSSNGEAKFLRPNSTYGDLETGFIKGNNNETMLAKLIGQGKYRKGSRINAYYPQSLSQIQRQVKKMATGGGVSGTDTVPAMLTPGEFVINKSSAQKIGYSNLSRMNKVGKYANGGIVQGFNTGGAVNPFSGRMAGRPVPVSIQTVSGRAAAMLGGGGGGGGASGSGSGGGGGGRGRRGQKGGGGGGDGGMGGALALSFAVSSLAAMAPTIDEESSARERAIASLAEFAVTATVAISALEAFGGVGGLFGGGMAGKANKNSNIWGRQFARNRGFSRKTQRNFGAVTGGVAGGATRAASGAAAGAITFMLAQQLGKAWQDLLGTSQELNKAIKDGNVARAEELAAIKNSEDRTVNSLSGAAGGAAAGFAIGGPAGAAVGLAIGAVMGAVLTEPKSTAVALAGAQAAAANAAKVMTKATEDATKALDEYKKGNVSATELFDPLKGAIAADTAARNKGIQAEGEAARFGSTTFGALSQMFGFSRSASDIERENKKNQEARNKELNKTATPVVREMATAFAAAGMTEEQFRGQFDLRQREALAAAGINLSDIFKSASAEVERARKQFESLNLGLSSVNATVNASLVALENLGSITNLGDNSAIQKSLNVLEAGLSSAAAGIAQSDFDAAVTQGAEVLSSLGATQDQITKFTESTRTINSLQAAIPGVLDNLKDSLDVQDGPLDIPALREKFAAALEGQLAGLVPDDMLSNLTDLIETGELSPEDIKQLQMGNLEPLQKLVDEFGEKSLAEFKEVFEKAIKLENELANLTKQRIALEDKLVSAQQKVLSAQMEAAQIIAEFGGPAVTAADKNANIIASANAQSGVIGGITDLRTGSAGELRQRNLEINQRLASIDAQRRATATGGGTLGRVEGTELQAEQDRLLKLSQDQYNITKQLIDVRKQELATIKARNAEEKKGLEALLQGNFEQFFDSQAATGATAAIATGNQALMNAYGPAGLAGAFQNLQNMQQQGVQTIFGQQIGGAGGLLEQGASAALSPFGLSGQAQVLAGTSQEELALSAEIRDLASTLPETAQVQENAANMLLNAAQMQITAAQAQLDAIKTRVQNRSSGGLIYASRGMFVPRGTDTVPAMLTPGEFVVNRAAVQRGNNLQILQAMNSSGRSATSAQALSRGGKVNNGVTYLDNGGGVSGSGSGINSETLNKFTTALNDFNKSLGENITKLQNTKFQITLNPANINVNLTGTSFLAQLTETLRTELFDFVGQEIQQYSVGVNGKLTKDTMRV